MSLNRQLQLRILQRAAAAYPAALKPEEFDLDDGTPEIPVVWLQSSTKITGSVLPIAVMKASVEPAEALLPIKATVKFRWLIFILPLYAGPGGGIS